MAEDNGIDQVQNGGEQYVLPTPPEPVRKWAYLAYIFAIVMIILSHIGHRLLPADKKSSITKSLNPMVLIMDVSGSMKGSKIEKAREALRGVVASLPQDQVVGLRLFARDTGLVAAPQVGAVALIDAAIDRIKVGGVAPHPTKAPINLASSVPALNLGGTTSIDKALLAAGEDTAQANPNQPWTWILVSDGQGNRPKQDIEAARQIAAKYPNVTCQTIGIEVSWSGRDELHQIAAILHGQSWVVNRDELELAMLGALSIESLAGFKGQTGSLGSRITAWWFTGGAIFVLFMAALLLRYILPEGLYTFILGGLAGVCVWGGAQALLPAYGSNITLVAAIQNGAYFMIVGYGIGLVLAVAEGVYLGEWKRVRSFARVAVPIGIFGGAIAGFAGQYFFVAFREAAADTVTVGFVTRIFGWALAGSIVGLCPGATTSARERATNGAIGGAIGGALGGLLFEAIVRVIGPSSVARFFAVVCLALLVTLMIQAADAIRRKAWFVVVEGEGQPVGKKYVMAKNKMFLGSHHTCDICLPGSLAFPPHVAAEINRDEENRHFIKPVDRYHVEVNNEKFAEKELEPGDRVSFGPAILVFHQRRWKRRG